MPIARRALAQTHERFHAFRKDPRFLCLFPLGGLLIVTRTLSGGFELGADFGEGAARAGLVKRVVCIVRCLSETSAISFGALGHDGERCQNAKHLDLPSLLRSMDLIKRKN